MNSIDVKVLKFPDFTQIFKGGEGKGGKPAAPAGGRNKGVSAGPRGGGVGIGNRGGTRGTPLARSQKAPRVTGGARTLPRAR